MRKPPLLPEPEPIDMGLSVKWSNFNLGANSETEIGYLYAWGETFPKESYTWYNYKWGDAREGGGGITKYTLNDGLVELEPEDDAATVNLGSLWRTPTKTECEELQENSIITFHENYKGLGVSGYSFVSKINNNEIFFPITEENGQILTKTLNTEYVDHRDNLSDFWRFEFDYFDGAVGRCYGSTVRPVMNIQ